MKILTTERRMVEFFSISGSPAGILAAAIFASLEGEGQGMPCEIASRNRLSRNLPL